MCLSTAYLNEKTEDNIALRYVARVSTRDGMIVLTDVMGYEKEIPGVLKFADLTDGYLIIGTEKHAV